MGGTTNAWMRSRRIKDEETNIISSSSLNEGLRESGFSFRDIAERLGRNVSIVHDCSQQWSREGTASRRPGSGRPRGTTEKEDRRVRRMAVAHRTASVAEIRTEVGTTVTQQTVTNRFLQGQLQARRPVA
ncbi:hypothetical protein AVEN_238086-1 [Araneus ventricosus]|uniref:Transposase Tc1-like domain-containing protein n=1 Tax=Araneus ventricosus TaxID=182803 RepID=A0A4Y2L1S1_ARAVE|nr:hypothetical protein AVEN_238086-1 [Araneus ventricosus]